MRLCEIPMTPCRQAYIFQFCSIVAIKGREIDEERSPVCLAVRTLLQMQQCPDEDALLTAEVASLITAKKDAIAIIDQEFEVLQDAPLWWRRQVEERTALWTRQVNEIAMRAGTDLLSARDARWAVIQQSAPDVVTAAIARLNSVGRLERDRKNTCHDVNERGGDTSRQGRNESGQRRIGDFFKRSKSDINFL